MATSDRAFAQLPTTNTTLQEVRDRIGNTAITGTSMPAGGVGLFGWLSAIWQLISDRFPPLVSGKLPVSTGGLQEGADIAGATLPTGGTSGRGWLSAIWKLISDRTASLSRRRFPATARQDKIPDAWGEGCGSRSQKGGTGSSQPQWCELHSQLTRTGSCSVLNDRAYASLPTATSESKAIAPEQLLHLHLGIEGDKGDINPSC